MKRRASFSAALAVIASVALALSCHQPGPCYGLGPGTRIGITFVDYYSGNPAYSQGDPPATAAGSAGPTGAPCDFFGFDVIKGETVEATVVSDPSTDEFCSSGLASFSHVANWTWSHGYSSGLSGMILEGIYEATNGPCTGSVDVILEPRQAATDIFAPAVPPNANAVLRREYGGAGAATCPSLCGGDFVVNLSRL